MMSMTDSQSVPLSAIQISPDYKAVWSSETCHAQSCGKRLDHALLHHRFPYSIVTFEIVTPEQVITCTCVNSNTATTTIQPWVTNNEALASSSTMTDPICAAMWISTANIHPGCLEECEIYHVVFA